MSPPVYKRMLRYCCDRLSFLGRELDHNLVTKFLSLLWNKVWDKVRSKTSTSGNAFFLLALWGRGCCTAVCEHSEQCIALHLGRQCTALHCSGFSQFGQFGIVKTATSSEPMFASSDKRKWRIWTRINHIDLVFSAIRARQDKSNIYLGNSWLKQSN